MANLFTGQMNSYRRNVAQIVSQAAIHLHNQVGSIGTALFDRHGTLVFNNDVLHYANESTFTHLVAECLNDPVTIHQQTMGKITVYAAALDRHHVFIVAGERFEIGTIDHFLASLRQVLPKDPATDD
jgi:hypothetical protein